MELTRAEAYKVMEGIKKLKEYKIGVKTGYTLIKNLRKLEEEFKISEELRNNLVKNLREDYAVKKEDGSFESDTTSMFGVKIKPEKLDDAVKEHMDYTNHLNEKVEYDIDTISLKDLESLDINMGLLADLENIIND